VFVTGLIVGLLTGASLGALVMAWAVAAGRSDVEMWAEAYSDPSYGPGMAEESDDGSGE